MDNKPGIFRFRQDLRVIDNTGFIQMYKNFGNNFFGVFVLDTNILNNFPKEDKRIGFLIDSLEFIETQLTNIGIDFVILIGNPIDEIPNLVKQLGAKAVYSNLSYGPYGKPRDIAIQKYCDSVDVKFVQFEDYLLVAPDKIPSRKVFTPYYNLWTKIDKKQVDDFKFPSATNYTNNKFKQNRQAIKRLVDNHLGEGNQWKHLSNNIFYQNFNYPEYTNTRNLPYLEGTSKISPYLSFGQLSIRQIYWHWKRLGLGDPTYEKELAWRDFWHHIHYFEPLSFFVEYQMKKRKIKWEENQQYLQRWQDGFTGYPLVDAGMRQLKQQNWMHNRVRMVVANFLCKDLLLDWRLGELHFRNYLLDYDSNVNTGNRQWCAGVGADPKPLRIFNPELQAQRFDPQCEYIKEFIPELRNTPNIEILNPTKYLLPYAKPIVQHKVQVEKFKKMYYEI